MVSTFLHSPPRAAACYGILLTLLGAPHCLTDNNEHLELRMKHFPTIADDLLALLERCKSGLKPGGMLVIKENVCERGFIVDPV